VALAVMLLLGAGLLLRSLSRLVRVDPGFKPEGLLTMEVQTAGQRFDSDTAVWDFYDRALQAVKAAPGVNAAAFTSLLPMGANYDAYGVAIEDKPNPNPELNPSALRFAVTPGYLEAMGIPVIQGRSLEPSDAASGAPLVVLVNQTFARRVWPGENVVGKRVKASSGPEWRTVVGVTGDVRHGGLDETPENQMYVPTRQWGWADNAMTLVVRTRADPAGLSRLVREAIWSVDRDQPIARVATMNQLLEATTSERRFALRLFAVFAGVAMVLAVAGIYGALSGSVSERTRELGIRLALGATGQDVVTMILKEGGRLIALGLALGLTGARRAAILDPVKTLGTE
jgi:putative ABC transport system permease protein